MVLLASRPIRRAIALAGVALLGIAAIGGAQTISDSPKPFAEFSNSALSLRDSIVALAKAQIGTRYKRGGSSPEKGFDCSGLVKYIMDALHLDVPRTARQQARVGMAVNRDTTRLLPGDLLTFAKNKRDVSHVAIYIGDGKYIHASVKAHKVIETSMAEHPASPLVKMWRGARRLLSPDDTNATVTTVASTRPDSTQRH